MEGNAFNAAFQNPGHQNTTRNCQNHADDHDACTIMSTLCNVLVEATFMAGKEPTTYNEGHVRIDLYDADYPTLEVFRAVMGVIKQAAKQQPEFIKIY